MRRASHRRAAVARAAVAAAILVVVGVPRIPVVWGVVWGLGDIVRGGVDDRQERLVDNPFPRSLAPSGYRLASVEPMFDGEETLGMLVSFAGPDDENSITYFPQGMVADEIYDYWTRGRDSFERSPLKAENLPPRSFCDEGELGEQHEVSCTAAFDGMAIIADSVNGTPEQGSLEHAVTLLRAGVEYWESIRD